MYRQIVKVNEHPVINFACAELREMLDVPVVEVSKGLNDLADRNSIVLGTWDSIVEYGLEIKDAWKEVFLQSTCSEDTFLIDGAAANHGRLYIVGKSERAVLYGIYQFCKEYQGLEWIYPGEAPCKVRNPREINQEIFSVYQPNILRRGFVFETINEPVYILNMVDWLAKNRVNEIFFTFMLWDQLKDVIGPEIVKRGLNVTLGGHSMKFFAKIDSEEKRQFDYKDVSWQESVFQQIVDYVKDVPNLTRISLWPEDVAIGEDDGESFLQTYVQFTEKLQRYLQSRGIDVEVEHIAYNAGLSWQMIELQNVESSPEINTLYAYWGRNYCYRFDQSEQKVDLRAFEALKEWRKTTAKKSRKLTIFEYYSDHFMLSALFPTFPTRIAEDIRIYNELGVDGITNLVVPYRGPLDYQWRWTHGCNSYVFSRAAWGDALEDILEDYYAYYPEECRESIKEIFKKIEQVVTKVTAWNVPLFPHRVVDVEKVKDTPYAAEIILFLQEIQREMGDPPLNSDDEHVKKFNAYFKHLKGLAEQLSRCLSPPENCRMNI